MGHMLMSVVLSTVFEAQAQLVQCFRGVTESIYVVPIPGLCVVVLIQHLYNYPTVCQLAVLYIFT